MSIDETARPARRRKRLAEETVVYYDSPPAEVHFSIATLRDKHRASHPDLEKLYQWIMRQHAEGGRLTAAEIISYLQNEIDSGGDSTSASPMPQFPDQHHQPIVSFATSITETSGSFTPAQVLTPGTSGHDDQSKNAVFSNALSSPVCKALQPFHIAIGEDYNAITTLSSGSGPRNNYNVREADTHDSSMDMHSDSPAHDSY